MTAQLIHVWAVLYLGKVLGLFTDEASAEAHKKEYTRVATTEYEVRSFFLLPTTFATVEDGEHDVVTALMQQLRDAKEEAARWKGGYQGAKNATIANRTRYHQLFDLYGAADHDDPVRRLVSLGEHYCKTRDAVLKACRIIEAGDARLLASDGPAGGQPPDISLQEWSEMYEALKAVQSLPNGKEEIS